MNFNGEPLVDVILVGIQVHQAFFVRWFRIKRHSHVSTCQVTQLHREKIQSKWVNGKQGLVRSFKQLQAHYSQTEPLAVEHWLVLGVPWKDHSPGNTNKEWLPMVSKQIRRNSLAFEKNDG